MPDPVDATARTSTRRPGLSVRTKLTLSYAGFLMLAWCSFMVVMGFVLSFLPDQNLMVIQDSSFAPARSDLWDVAYPVAILGTLAMAAAGLGGGWLLAGRMLRPLDAIGAAAREAAAGSLTHRVEMQGPDDEFRRLADVLDDMLERLEQSFDEQRRFTSNASHELRTPHAVMKTMLEVARADVSGREVDVLLSRLTEMNDRAIETTEGLLRLARTDHAALLRERCDLDAVVRETLGSLAAEIRAAGLEIELEPGDLAVEADSVLLRSLVRNIIANAVRHNVDTGGLVRVATLESSSGLPVLEVRNTGDVMDAELISTLTEPFVRGRGRTRPATRTGGSGLGLAIVDSIARVHRADLDLRARPSGGLVVTVTFAAAVRPAGLSVPRPTLRA